MVETIIPVEMTNVITLSLHPLKMVLKISPRPCM